jgi:hypothetical protein
MCGWTRRRHPRCRRDGIVVPRARSRVGAGHPRRRTTDARLGSIRPADRLHGQRGTLNLLQAARTFLTTALADATEPTSNGWNRPRDDWRHSAVAEVNQDFGALHHSRQRVLRCSPSACTRWSSSHRSATCPRGRGPVARSCRSCRHRRGEVCVPRLAHARRTGQAGAWHRKGC